MFPAANVSSAVAKPVQSAPSQTAQKTSQPQAPETARTSSGESAAANIKAETSLALQAPEQTSVAPRLRDQETAERTDRSFETVDKPTGPPPTFEETPLERQARVALDPPVENLDDRPADPVTQPITDDLVTGAEAEASPLPADQPDPAPTPAEKAEASFSETRTLTDTKEPATVDIKN